MGRNKQSIIDYSNAKVICRSGRYFVEVPEIDCVTEWAECGDWRIRLEGRHNYRQVFLKKNVLYERNGDDMTNPGKQQTSGTWTIKPLYEGSFGPKLATALHICYARCQVLTEIDLPVLRGMEAAGISEAGNLIEAINSNGTITFTTE